MKEKTMNSIHTITIALASSLLLSLPALADTTPSPWGEWNLQRSNQDAFFTAQTFSEAELIQSELSTVETFDQGNIMGTQLAGTPYNGLDTDQIELNEQGIPVDLLDQPMPVDVGVIELNEDGIPFDLAQRELNAHEYN